ncbi:TonB-dependent receptor [Alteromonas aestuariivivens]|uniref:TonB-dependent receptor n=1 Tax=Alteromonas aestuariivivens TaxID=1938339 RepID=A0A3D8MDE6_9ALTE|nr:TonB-dependent receptor [Alteromonas aestuariivivens]RDV28203.1 TonB-dependent receptor [Alteromonas aestuariivivens]
MSIKRNRPSIAGGAACLLLTFATPSVLAQEVKQALDNNASPDEETLEVIEVSGVRASLENALNVKRSAPSIVDAISATDIDALPALDLGEALQAIPGVQLNSDQEGRQSSISLRGLGSGFVKTTAFGQSFATPSAASNLNAVGSPNPFAAFESSIFDGVTVVKSPTADLQAGGVAGIVDKQLQQALSKKDGTFTVSVGGRYEELTGEIDPNLKLAGVKHLIDDKLAVAFKLGASGQTFRRDTFDIIDYVPVDAGRATNIDEYREYWGIPDDAEVRVPMRGRNVSEFSDGDRVSMSGNIEYRLTDDFKIGAHLLFSERDLDDGTKETTSFETGFNRNNSARDNYDALVTLDMDTAPFAYDRLADEADAAQIYGVSNIDFTDGTFRNENRKTTFNEKSQGIMLYADYVADEWIFDGVVTHSEAENNFENVGIYYNHSQDWRAQFNYTPADGNRISVPSVPTGFDGTINTGQGDLNNVVVSGSLDTPYVYDDLIWSQPITTSSGLTSVDDANQGRRLQFGINGRVRDLSRDYSSAEFGAQRYTDFGFGDGLRFDAIKFGGRISREALESIDQRQGPAGIDTAQIGSGFMTDQVLSNVQNDYFNGNMPGTFDHTNGWVTLNNEAAIAALQTGIVTDLNDLVTGRSYVAVYPGLERNRTGFWDTQNNQSGLPTNLGYNFDAEQDILAMYVTTDFSGELGPVFYSGNMGVRYEETNNTFDGFETQVDNQGRNGVAVLKTFEDDYSHTLPMMNIAFELTDEVILRGAYYDGLVRPNLLAQRPTASVRGGAETVRLDLPTATVRPYDATNYDVSLEWYNREGSAISIGYFRKDISNLFDEQEGYCPEDGSNEIVNALLGDVERVDIGGGEFSCQQVEPITDVDGNLVYREVTINTPINNDEEIKVEGIELAVQQKLDFLPYPWNGFGGVFNYTKLKQTGDEAALTRVSPESYNIIGYWENDGISIRVAYNWRDDLTLQGANSFLGTNTRTRKAMGRLDFVASYALTKKAKVFLRGYNLTDEIGQEFLGFDERAVSRMTYTGRIYQVSLNYKF